jgi:RNA polymerase sigma factor (sigma-70 family)
MLKPKVNFTDNDFIEGLKHGDDSVLKALYKKYYNLVLKLVVSNNGSSEAAQDVYQETIIILFEKCKDPEFKLNCQLQTYVYSVARNIWLKQLKKHGNVSELKEYHQDVYEDANLDIKGHLKKEESIDKVYKSLEELGEPCASLIKDFYIKKMNMDQISEKFGYTNSDNAKNQKYKCLQRLKRLFFDNFTLVD